MADRTPFPLEVIKAAKEKRDNAAEAGRQAGAEEVTALMTSRYTRGRRCRRVRRPVSFRSIHSDASHVARLRCGRR